MSLACRAYHFWHEHSPRSCQKTASGFTARPIPWGIPTATIGHDITERPESVQSEEQIYKWLEQQLIPHLEKNLNVSNEEFALVLVANYDPFRNAAYINDWLNSRWHANRFSALMLLLASCLEIISTKHVPEICRKHVIAWRDWVHMQEWKIPDWLPPNLFTKDTVKTTDLASLIDLAVVTNNNTGGPFLNQEVPTILTPPVLDDLQLLVKGHSDKWPSLRRLTWWMDEYNWVVRVAHVGPDRNDSQSLNGCGSVYHMNPNVGAIEWKTWTEWTAYNYHCDFKITKESLAFGLLKSKLDYIQTPALLVHLYSWWKSTKESAALAIMEYLTGKTTDDLRVVLDILEATDESGPAAIKAVFEKSISRDLPSDITW